MVGSYLIDLLKLPTDEILSVGSNAKLILKEWHKVTLLMPDFCDCKLRGYVEFLKKHYEISDK